MNHRRIAAATATVWLVSIPLGALIHHGVLAVQLLGVWAAVYGAIIGAIYRPVVDVSPTT